MEDIFTDAVAIVAICLLIAAAAVALTIFRPSARRHRRHKRHGRRPKIDLLKQTQTGPPAEPDA